MKYTEEQFEQEVLKYVDRLKDLVSAKMWKNILMDCSKNELFILWLLYRQNEVNMTQIAEYINVPLNTATGIISRMETRELVKRERSPEDKRVVTIRIGDKGHNQIQEIIEEFMYYGKKLVTSFSTDEIELLLRMIHSLTDIMSEERSKELSKPKVRKITIE